MTVGDAVGDLSDLASGSTIAMKPAAGVEWIIHNIYHVAEVELYVTDGSIMLLFAESTAKGSWSGFYFHMTNTQYFRLKNTNAASKYVGYDGVVSKE